MNDAFKSSRRKPPLPHGLTLRFLVVCAGVVVAGSVLDAIAGIARAENAGNSSADQAKVFREKVQPLLKQYCLTCHEGPRVKGKLRLDTLGAEGSRAAWKSVQERLTANENAAA